MIWHLTDNVLTPILCTPTGTSYTQYVGCNALREEHNRKSYENLIWGEGYTQGPHGFKGSQHTVAFVAHIGEKTRKPDIAKSPIRAHKEREGGLCGCCAAIENSNPLCGPIAEKSSRGWDIERIEISRLPCPYATSSAPLCTHNHEERGAYMYNKTKPHFQTDMHQNHQSIGNE